MKRYKEEQIKKCLMEILANTSMNALETDALISVLMASDKYGVHTHGLSVFKSHVDKIIKGGYRIGIQPIIEKETTAFMTVNANNTVGMYSAIFCMKRAINHAKKSGIYSVLCKNCNTYGPAFYYTKMATDHHMIGITFCNSPPAMAPWGGCDKMLGTNPLAVGIPGLNKGPILFDMATSIVAKSKINEARKNGENIPKGWAMDLEGNNTTDPDVAIKGMILPMAGAKGYGLAMVIDIIAGLLSGAAYLNNVGHFYSKENDCMNVGQYFMAIEPKIVMSSEFYEKIDKYIEDIHLSKHKNETEILFPGERKNREYKLSEINGIELTDITVESINAMLKEYKSHLQLN